MNSTSQNAFDNGSTSEEVDATLRLIANLPAPLGLEEQVLTGVLARRRQGRVLAWPVFLRPDSGWMRAAAAAAIVFVVAGGGWGVYSHVQQGQPVRTIAMPPHVSAPGSFSGAGAMRTPQTLESPVLVQPAKPHPLQGKQTKKAVARTTPIGPSNGQPSAAKVPGQPATPGSPW